MEVSMNWEGISEILFRLIPLLIGITLLKNSTPHTFHNPKFKNSDYFIIRVFNSFAGIDFFCRFLQFTLIFIAGRYKHNARFRVDHQRFIVEKVKSLDRVSNIFGGLRKFSRLPRTGFLIKDLWNMYRAAQGQTRGAIILEKVFGILGDFLNVTYFILDHITCLFLLHILTNMKILTFIDFWCNYLWMFASIFYFLKDLTMIYRYIILGELKGDAARKMKLFLLFDSIRNFLDIFVNYAFMYPQHFQKDEVGLMGMVATVFWLTDFSKY